MPNFEHKIEKLQYHYMARQLRKYTKYVSYSPFVRLKNKRYTKSLNINLLFL